MPATTTTTIAELMEVGVKEARFTSKNRQDLTKLCERETLKPGEISKKFPKMTGSVASELAEGADATPEALTGSGPTLTPHMGAVWSTFLSDLSNLGNSLMQKSGRQAADAVLTKKNRDMFALFAGFSQSLGALDTAVTEAVVRQAVKLLTKAGGNSPIYWVFTVEVWSQIIDIFKASTGLNNLLSDRAKDAIMSGKIDEGITIWGCVPVMCNSGIDESAGVTTGLFRKEALGYLTAWDYKFEVQRRARAVGSDIIASSAYRLGEVDDTQGVKILTLGEVA
jgi:hypothetical protein